MGSTNECELIGGPVCGRWRAWPTEAYCRAVSKSGAPSSFFHRSIVFRPCVATLVVRGDGSGTHKYLTLLQFGVKMQTPPAVPL